MSALPIPHPVRATPAHVLSTPELFAAVHDLAPQVAVFDCDGTLWSGDAGSSFMWWTMENGVLSPEKTAWLQGRYDGYKRGELSELTICGDMVTVYAGLSIQDLREAAAIFFRERIAEHIFPELQELVAKLAERGTAIWAVSSTNHWVIEEGVRRFGIAPDRILAARVVEENGFATDRLLDVPTDEGKVMALQYVGITAPDAVFGNSVHDAAMLAIARRAFPVNPTPALLERSVTEHWSVFWPASVLPSL